MLPCLSSLYSLTYPRTVTLIYHFETPLRIAVLFLYCSYTIYLESLEGSVLLFLFCHTSLSKPTPARGQAFSSTFPYTFWDETYVLLSEKKKKKNWLWLPEANISGNCYSQSALKSSAQQDTKNKVSADAHVLKTYGCDTNVRISDPQIMHEAAFNFLVERLSIIFFLKLPVPSK